jgi:hypothetical protein
MIRMLTAHTREIDDIEVSAAEILEQLAPGERLLRHSVGILSFHREFLDSGAVGAVCEALPFDCIGGTTSASAVPGDMGDLVLTVTVLTSDDVGFRAGAVPLGDNPVAAVQGLYAELAPSSAEKPALLLTVAPFLGVVGGDDFIEALDAVSGGIPLFGALASSHRPDLSGAEPCLNGEHRADLFTLIAVFGVVNPEFYRTIIPCDKMMHQAAFITKSEKNLIQGINGIKPLDYLKSVGLVSGNGVAGLNSTPFVLTLADGSMIVRAAYQATEDGCLRTGGAVPQGAQIGFANCNAEVVLRTARESVGRPLAASGGRNALIFSCDSRKWALGARTTAEMGEMARCLDNAFPYRIAYAFGEICPVKNRKGRLVNSFQNSSAIACLL